MIQVKKKDWDKIPLDYKGIFQDYYNECPEWKGRKCVMSGCITNNPRELGMLFIEGVHFVIVD